MVKQGNEPTKQRALHSFQMHCRQIGSSGSHRMEMDGELISRWPLVMRLRKWPILMAVHLAILQGDSVVVNLHKNIVKTKP